MFNFLRISCLRKAPGFLSRELHVFFRISFKIGNTDIKVPKIHLAYLRNCSVNYNPTGSSFHEDGQPNEMTMTLTSSLASSLITDTFFLLRNQR